MNERKTLWLFLSLELCAILWAIAVFKLIPSRLVAGIVAGCYFVGFAGFIFFKIIRQFEPLKLCTTYPLVIHLFVIAIPMLLMRLLYPEQPFEQVHIWGLSGPVLHQISGQVFAALVTATVLDILLSYRNKTNR